MLHARATRLDPGMRLDTSDASAAVWFDQQLWNELFGPRFVAAEGAMLLGAVGSANTLPPSPDMPRRAAATRFLVTRADKVFQLLKAARFDNTESRRLVHVQACSFTTCAFRPSTPPRR
jgi:hypothetical protein